MADLEKLAEISMKIIAYAGAAKSNYVLALEAMKKGDLQEYELKMKAGEESYVEAHSFHREVLQIEVQTLEPQVSLILMHAEDQLMNAETIKFLVTEIVQLKTDKGWEKNV